MMLRVTLWGTPDDIATATQRLKDVFSILHESENEPDEAGLWVKRYLKVGLKDAPQEKKDTPYPL